MAEFPPVAAAPAPVAAALIPVAAALDQLLAAARTPDTTRTCPLAECLNAVLAEPLVARVSSPAFDNSAMDGYAVRLADLGADMTLPLSDRITAGSNPKPLTPGTAARIFTGAPLPEGADSICPQENCVELARESGLVQESEEEIRVHIRQQPRAGEHIRRAGEDFQSGNRLIPAGTRLGAHHLGLCAAAGQAEVRIFSPLRVALFITGDELVDPGQSLRPGQIYNSNQVMLQALLAQMGCQLVLSSVLPDNPDQIRQALSDAAGRANLILTGGGVSVGEEDHMKAVLQELGQLSLWRIAIKPGKPMAFGRIGHCDYLGLPGNPVSALVTFLRFAAPFIRRRQGEQDVLPRPLKVVATNNAPAGSREEYLRARLCPDGVEILPGQGSHRLAPLTLTTGLVRRPANRAICAGELVDYFTLQGFLSES